MVLLLLGLLVAYCCWGAPCCRGCCCRPRRHAAPHAQRQDGPAARAAHTQVDELGGLGLGHGAAVCTPTIILLPQGRMLVVDGAVLSSLQADASGLDLIRLGENLVRAQRRQDATILDADVEAGLAGLGLAGLKGSLGGRTLDGGPPTYEELFGFTHERLPVAAPAPPSPCSSPRPSGLGGGGPAAPASASASPSHGASSATQPPSYDELVDKMSAPPSPSDSPRGGLASSSAAPAAPGDAPAGAAVCPAQDGDQNIRESRV